MVSALWCKIKKCDLILNSSAFSAPNGSLAFLAASSSLRGLNPTGKLASAVKLCLNSRRHMYHD